MSVVPINHESVVSFLRSEHYTEVETLGNGAFAEVLSAVSPAKQEVAIKIIKQEDLSETEDKIWPLLNHPNILPVLEIFDIGLKLFVSPRHPIALDYMIHSGQFIADVRGLDRIRKWLGEVLSGLDYLHTAGFAHMDVKSDNVLITSGDSAVLCDFSGLSRTATKITKLCAPLQFRPPECWHTVGSRGVHGVAFDMWTFGLMSLNVLSGHRVQENIRTVDGWSWDSHTRPVLVEALQEAPLFALMSEVMPFVRISSQDVSAALHFLLSLMRIVPGERPTAKEAAGHPFLRTADTDQSSGDAHISEHENQMDVSGCGNPFKSVELSPGSSVTVATAEDVPFASGDFTNTTFRAESVSGEAETGLPPSGVNDGAKKVGFRKRIKGWIGKKFRKMFPKKNYILSTESEAMVYLLRYNVFETD